MLDINIVQPKTLSEIWKTISKIRDPYRYLAGGTDIVVAAKRDVGVPCTWVDISKIKELNKIEEQKSYIFIGSLVTYSDIAESNIVKRWAPSLYEVCPKFASPPIRSLATIGGNCANASPAGDGIPSLYAENASIVLKLRNSVREVPVEKFFLGPKKTVLKKGELVYGLKIPKKSGYSGTFLKIGPRNGFSISKVSLALSIKSDGSKTIQDVRIGLGAVGPTVIRAIKTESYLKGKPLTQKLLEEAQKLIQSEVAPITDHRSTAEYRKAMTGVLLGRVLTRKLG